MGWRRPLSKKRAEWGAKGGGHGTAPGAGGAACGRRGPASALRAGWGGARQPPPPSLTPEWLDRRGPPSHWQRWQRWCLPAALRLSEGPLIPGQAPFQPPSGTDPLSRPTTARRGRSIRQHRAVCIFSVGQWVVCNPGVCRCVHGGPPPRSSRLWRRCERGGAQGGQAVLS